jgi:Zn-finger nucleic acid-binding protein
MEEQFLIACKVCHRQYDVTGMRLGEHLRCRCGELMMVPERPVHEAKILHCSGCGGKLRAAARKCEYCGGEVTLAEKGLGTACPRCFARLPRGARFCSHCGVQICPESMRVTPASAACPRCKGSLVLSEFPGGHYTECSSCGGIWLDMKSFDRVLEEKDSQALGPLVGRPTSGDPSPALQEVEKVQYIPCLVCGHFMNRKNFAGCSGVIVDWCKGHGYWFDPTELERLVAFIKRGGLDKARKMEIERAKEELRRTEDRRKARASTGAMLWDGQVRSQQDWLSGLGQVFSALLQGFGK